MRISRLPRKVLKILLNVLAKMKNVKLNLVAVAALLRLLKNHPFLVHRLMWIRYGSDRTPVRFATIPYIWVSVPRFQSIVSKKLLKKMKNVKLKLGTVAALLRLLKNHVSA